MIPKSNHQYNNRSIEGVATFYCRTVAFKYSYFLHTTLEWNKLGVQIRSESFLSFKNSLLKIGRPTAKPTYKIPDPIRLKFLTRLRLDSLMICNCLLLFG